jgi:hypothetical protein
MSVKMIQDRLDGYGCRSTLEEEQALREITQEIVLAALGRTDFFQKTGFQGGTCLRIFHGVNRFSEDLDFALQNPDASFVLQSYLEGLAKELTAYGYGLEMADRSKLDQAVRMAFVKDDSLGNLLRLNYKPNTGPLRKLRIKVEVDTNPPAGASFETKYLDFRFPRPCASSTCPAFLPASSTPCSAASISRGETGTTSSGTRPARRRPTMPCCRPPWRRWVPGRASR